MTQQPTTELERELSRLDAEYQQRDTRFTEIITLLPHHRRLKT